MVPAADPDVARLNVEEIDSFTDVATVDLSLANEQLKDGLLDVPEREVKAAIHTLLGDPHIRKDWGGERSDIFTDEVVVAGRRTTTAMALKGPSGKASVTISSYGKNGDQIVRLFEEPAELFIVQANGKFESTLIKHVLHEAQATKRPVSVRLVDGTDTARLLLA